VRPLRWSELYHDVTENTGKTVDTTAVATLRQVLGERPLQPVNQLPHSKPAKTLADTNAKLTSYQRSTKPAIRYTPRVSNRPSSSRILAAAQAFATLAVLINATAVQPLQQDQIGMLETSTTSCWSIGATDWCDDWGALVDATQHRHSLQEDRAHIASAATCAEHTNVLASPNMPNVNGTADLEGEQVGHCWLIAHHDSITTATCHAHWPHNAAMELGSSVGYPSRSGRAAQREAQLAPSSSNVSAATGYSQATSLFGYLGASAPHSPSGGQLARRSNREARPHPAVRHRCLGTTHPTLWNVLVPIMLALLALVELINLETDVMQVRCLVRCRIAAHKRKAVRQPRSMPRLLLNKPSLMAACCLILLGTTAALHTLYGHSQAMQMAISLHTMYILHAAAGLGAACKGRRPQDLVRESSRIRRKRERRERRRFQTLSVEIWPLPRSEPIKRLDGTDTDETEPERRPL
jgi:hypothetical protein